MIGLFVNLLLQLLAEVVELVCEIHIALGNSSYEGRGPSVLGWRASDFTPPATRQKQNNVVDPKPYR